MLAIVEIDNAPTSRDWNDPKSGEVKKLWFQAAYVKKFGDRYPTKFDFLLSNGVRFEPGRYVLTDKNVGFDQKGRIAYRFDELVKFDDFVAGVGEFIKQAKAAA